MIEGITQYQRKYMKYLNIIALIYSVFMVAYNLFFCLTSTSLLISDPNASATYLGIFLDGFAVLALVGAVHAFKKHKKGLTKYFTGWMFMSRILYFFVMIAFYIASHPYSYDLLGLCSVTVLYATFFFVHIALSWGHGSKPKLAIINRCLAVLVEVALILWLSFSEYGIMSENVAFAFGAISDIVIEACLLAMLLILEEIVDTSKQIKEEVQPIMSLSKGRMDVKPIHYVMAFVYPVALLVITLMFPIADGAVLFGHSMDFFSCAFLYLLIPAVHHNERNVCRIILGAALFGKLFFTFTAMGYTFETNPSTLDKIFSSTECALVLVLLLIAVFGYAENKPSKFSARLLNIVGFLLIVNIILWNIFSVVYTHSWERICGAGYDIAFVLGFLPAFDYIVDDGVKALEMKE